MPVKSPQVGKREPAMSEITDTIMNIEIFVFVGILVWLYFKPVNVNKD